MHHYSPGETVSTGTQQKLLRFCQHVVSGMSYLASKSFIHRDLAARNILVSEDGICKVRETSYINIMFIKAMHISLYQLS